MRQGQSVLRHGRTRICTPEYNWEPSQLEPNGTSAYVFDNESGKAVCECLISSDPNTIDIPLYPGKYDIMVINNTEEELASIDFTGIENLHTFNAVISANKEPKYANLLSKAEDNNSYLTAWRHPSQSTRQGDRDYPERYSLLQGKAGYRRTRGQPNDRSHPGTTNRINRH